ncbi:MAG: hypothetical protein HC795_14075 [Coleofasciculaceae cyanobacterium RL_1_1]|nr:hypothetical protein [Coleofasciculaceae cyanobacterium RL_1_1]
MAFVLRLITSSLIADRTIGFVGSAVAALVTAWAGAIKSTLAFALKKQAMSKLDGFICNIILTFL